MEKIWYTDRNNKKINLKEASLKELEKLNQEEEVYFAKEIKKKKPFSKEREKYSREAYEKIFQIADWKHAKEPVRIAKKGYGATEWSIKLVNDILKEVQKKKEKIIFYEAGVGKGSAIENIKEKIKGTILGCDVFLSEEVKAYNSENIKLEEETLYWNLQKIEDNSIDIFYADNVLEHIVEDEYEKTCEEISKKMKRKGIAIFIIPNRYVGPADASKYFLKMGSKAEGFHFREESFSQNIKVFQKYGLQLDRFCWRGRRCWKGIDEQIHYSKRANFLNGIKKKMEKQFGKIPERNKRWKTFKTMAYDVYVLVKK